MLQAGRSCRLLLPVPIGKGRYMYVCDRVRHVLALMGCARSGAWLLLDFEGIGVVALCHGASCLSEDASVGGVTSSSTCQGGPSHSASQI
jgi:hypothetical protein